MKNNVFSLFPIPLGLYSLNRELTNEETNFILSQEYYSNQGNLTSSDVYILDKENMKDLKIFFHEKINSFFKEVYRKSDVSIYITQSWINVTHQNNYHHTHSHANSFLSGVFYVNALKNIDSIVFYRPKTNSFFIDPDDANLFNADSWKFPIEKNDLIFFPSYLDHSVPTNTSHNHTRVSISFNSFIKGKLGNKDRLTELFLKGE